MQRNAGIYSELKELGSPLADWEVVNVFRVPPGFFESFPDRINALKENSPEFPELRQPMEVPAGYFEGLADNIMNKIRLEDENFQAGDEPSVEHLPGNRNIFRVPLHYFEELAALVVSKIHKDDQALMNEAEPSLGALPGNQNVFKVPLGYFENFADSILEKLYSEETVDDVSSVFTSKTNVFTVPQGYFENLPSQIIANVATPKAKVVAMPRRSVFQYAIAATLTGLLGLSLFGVFNNKEQPAVSETSSLIFANANRIIQSNSFEAEMNTLDESDIVSFLKAEGQDIKAALVASVATEQNTPEADQYFFDEKALDNFLNENHITNSTN